MDHSPKSISVSGSLADMLNDCSIDRVMAIDQEWRIIAWNKTSTLLSGISKAEVMDKKLLDLFPQLQHDHEMINAIHTAFAGSKSFVPASEHVFHRHYFENHFIPLHDDGNNIIGVMNIMHDVAHRVKAEQQLQDLNIALNLKYQQLERALDEQATFTYVTTHNIKEPMRLVYSSLELLVRAEAKVLSDGGKANLRRIQASLNRMNLLLDDILTLSGINSFLQTESPVDLDNVLMQVKTAMKDKITEQDAIIETAHLPVITGYKDMLYYLFYNLLDNAIKFRHKATAPQVIISSQLITLSGQSKDFASKGEYTRLTFADNGIGIEQQDQERIFTLFEKLQAQQYPGSGLGLALCRKIMNAHDGYITVESVTGKGAVFHCYFPVVRISR